MSTRRAYGQADKDARRLEILAAAERLFVTGRVLPTAAQIAAAAGLAKGTIYLYFRSREDIFAALLQEEWVGILDAIGAQLDASGAGTDVAAAFIDSLVALIDAKPNLMPLDAMLSELRKGMSEEARQQFHDLTSGRIFTLGDTLDRALELPAGRGTQLLVRSHAFARGLWQSMDSIDPDCDVATKLMPNFADELRAALTEYWRGALELTGASVVPL